MTLSHLCGNIITWFFKGTNLSPIIDIIGKIFFGHSPRKLPTTHHTRTTTYGNPALLLHCATFKAGYCNKISTFIISLRFLLLLLQRFFGNTMDVLSTIQAPISEQLAMLNSIMVERLHGSNALINKIVDNYLLTKGKQIRPILILLCARMTGEISQSTILSAAAIELMHNASLIHDDVVDNSMYRRGKPTINATEDNRIAVLMGDHFVSCALQCGVATGMMSIISAMGQLGQELAHGEIDQIDNARAHRLSEERYFDVIRRKTASLFRTCMHVGAISAHADDEQRERLEQFGELLGLCFQIKDDIFDYYEDKVIGKPTGNDLREGKITLPMLYAITHHDDEENRRMRSLLDRDNLDSDEIEQLIAYAKENGGIEYAYRRMEELRNEAVEALSSFPESETKQALITLLDYTISRNK